MTNAQKQIRMNVRNFLLVATDKELVKELRISREAGDEFRAQCVLEIMADRVAEEYMQNAKD
jgi:hypothetical protein